MNDQTSTPPTASPLPPAINHWGKWVDPTSPIIGVQAINTIPPEFFDEFYNGINLTCLECKDRDSIDNENFHNPCDMCEAGGDLLVGTWKQDPDGKYTHDESGEYAGILREDVLQVVFSKFTTRAALCSPCYPGQADLDTPGGYLAYCLPPLEKDPIPPAPVHPCSQCGRDLGNEFILGPVCGTCCRKNHKKVAG